MEHESWQGALAAVASVVLIGLAITEQGIALVAGVVAFGSAHLMLREPS